MDHRATTIALAGVLIVVGSFATASAADRDVPLPYDLGVRVVLGADAGGSETLADDLEAVLVDELAARACYRSVRGRDDDRRDAYLAEVDAVAGRVR